MKTAFIYSEKFASYYYGGDHPMKPARLKLTFDLMEELKIAELPDSKLIEARQAAKEEMLLFHTPEYLNTLKEANTGIIPVSGPNHSLGLGDNPVFNGVYDWSSYCCGASIQAAELVANGEADIAFNIAGGLHHAMPNRAEGFCYINDPAVAIKYLVNQGKRVAYIDIDAHHGDGVEYAFYDSRDVLTISIHEDGHWLFPGTGFVTDIGINDSKGFAVNLPLPPYTYDELYIKAFNEVVPPFIEAFQPDIIVTQLGVDSFETDPITHLSLTTNGFEAVVKQFRSFGIPWVALGGGGYDLSNVARAWTLAWAIMNNVELPNVVPPDFLQKNSDIFRSGFLRDQPVKSVPLSREDIDRLEGDIKHLRAEVLPLLKRNMAGKVI